MEQEPRARILLDQMVCLLQEVAQKNPNVVEKVKLQHCSKKLVCTTILTLIIIAGLKMLHHITQITLK